ncbi:hypothetical protein Acy02nite_40690 [Actinoplanes cyaneus]|uniref:Beta-galactosidase trimerisation domain-containing protein n=1 Tax=Actinoplanes cyaneus TaxID=52696 RepID=A0A919M6F0_9ACTN|nr:hypothetical protein Acy02nite_40690 [Actinoplanes cyaneus]
MEQGRLLRDGQPFLAIGVNYHPSRAGCRLWIDWDPVALRRDFAGMAGAGLTTVRFFVFWRDFEPEPGRYREKALDRLREAVETAGQEGLSCVVSLLTIWMNGQLLDLPWRHGRDLWRDEEMLDRQEAFARAVATTLHGVAGLLAIDLGDEIGNVRTGPAPTREQVAAWQARLAGALRDERPGTLVVQANDASGVLGPAPFGPDNAGGLDLVAVHGFPTWAAGSIESTLSYKATSLAPFLVRYAAAYGVPIVDELGSYGVDEATAAAYLGAAAASALANGAAGIVPWCWQDIASRDEPYQDRPGEREVGLHRLDGSPKPAMTALRRVASAASGLVPGRARAPIALYVPERQRGSGASYLDSGPDTVATFYAYLLLKRAHLDFDVVAGDLSGYRMVVCPSVTRVIAADLDRLTRHVDDGGLLWYSLGDHLHGFPGADLAGVELVDYSLLPDGRTTLDWAGRQWPLEWPATARPVDVRATTARTVGRWADGSGAVFQNRDRVFFCAAPVERQLDRPGRLAAYPWEWWYRELAGLAGIVPDPDCVDPDVEIVPDRGAGRRAVLINHGAGAVRPDLRWGGEERPVPLEPKQWRIVTRGADGWS